MYTGTGAVKTPTRCVRRADGAVIAATRPTAMERTLALTGCMQQH